jgi:hypothetical protein
LKKQKFIPVQLKSSQTSLEHKKVEVASGEKKGTNSTEILFFKTLTLTQNIFKPNKINDDEKPQNKTKTISAWFYNLAR